MNLSRNAVSEFQAIYKSLYGSEIAYEQAENMGLNLLRFFRLIYRQVPKTDKEKLAMYRSGDSLYKYN